MLREILRNAQSHARVWSPPSNDFLNVQVRVGPCFMEPFRRFFLQGLLIVLHICPFLLALITMLPFYRLMMLLTLVLD